jgi:exosortase/archaeosortase family protein
MPSARFAIVFALVSATLLGVYYYPYAAEGTAQHCIAAFLHRYAASAACLIRTFDPSVQVVGDEILGRFSLRIVRTCDAMDVEILLASALVAWPLRWSRRALAVAVGCALLYALNVVRIASLYFVGLHWPERLEVAHLEVWPAVMLVVAVGFFLAVTTRYGQPHA